MKIDELIEKLKVHSDPAAREAAIILPHFLALYRACRDSFIDDYGAHVGAKMRAIEAAAEREGVEL